VGGRFGDDALIQVLKRVYEELPARVGEIDSQ
jgi:hypothetical protein